VDDPDSVEIDDEMAEGTFFVVCLEKDSVPIDSVEFREPLLRWKVDKAQLKLC
jgi:hypothetical protein